jgi:hypothetical protein
MAHPVNRAIGKLLFGGQKLSNGYTFKLSGTTAVGDIVAPTANAGEMARPADTGDFVGQLTQKDSDSYGTVVRGENMIARRTGAVSKGIQWLVGDGSGGVKASGGAGTGTKCLVIDSYTGSDSVNYVLFDIL